ncbi:PH domain-containing protein [Verrucomicrobiales bacterium]|nr:PH domain-containing protein [Verrucomicrobiales bacterium]MDC0276179.1 PH domain-containing protein [Verrucomicrobiales bacterium]
MSGLADNDEVYVLKDGRRLGPYSREELLERVDRGEIEYEDVCLRDFSSECERVHEVLDWDEDEAPPELAVGEIRPSPEPIISVREKIEPGEVERMEEGEPEPEVPEEIEISPHAPPKDPTLILYAGHQSLLSFPKSLFIILVSLGLGIWFRETSGWILLVGLIFALIAISYIVLERTAKLYLITPRRVEIVKGLFAKSSNEVRIDDIRTINVVRTGFLGMIGVGRVEFASSGGQDVEVAFDDVWDAQRVKGLVRRIQDADV